jgi:hypothetical protein
MHVLPLSCCAHHDRLRWGEAISNVDAARLATSYSLEALESEFESKHCGEATTLRMEIAIVTYILQLQCT